MRKSVTVALVEVPSVVCGFITELEPTSDCDVNSACINART